MISIPTVLTLGGMILTIVLVLISFAVGYGKLTAHLDALSDRVDERWSATEKRIERQEERIGEVARTFADMQRVYGNYAGFVCPFLPRGSDDGAEAPRPPPTRQIGPPMSPA